MSFSELTADAADCSRWLTGKQILIAENSPILNSPARNVRAEDIPTEEFQRFLRRFTISRKYFKGIGLAAPQIGVPLRIAVVRPQFWKTDLVLINPELTPLGNSLREGPEGCLSLPNRGGEVYRYKSIRVRYLDEQGVPQDRTFRGYTATVIQHEYDHLDGILFTQISAGTQTQRLPEIPEVRLLRPSDQIFLMELTDAWKQEPENFRAILSGIRKDIRRLTGDGAGAAFRFLAAEGAPPLTSSEILREIVRFYRMRIYDPENLDAVQDWIKSDRQRRWVKSKLAAEGTPAAAVLYRQL